MFSDERVVAQAERFVPAADEVWRLQRGSDADCLFFQRAVNGGEPITDKGTRQGIWVFAPSGRLLANVNSNRAEVVLAMLERGLAAFAALDESERHLAADAALEPAFRWEDDYPADGLALERFARDLAGPSDPATPERDASVGERFNRDFAWFSAEEARALVPAEPVVGAVQRAPDALAARLARFHLVDNVRGQTLPYAAEEVRSAWIEAEVVARDGARVELALHGATELVADGTWRLGENLWKPARAFPRGIATTLVGRATFDLDAGRFRAFDAVAFGRRWGRAPTNGRAQDAAPSVVGFHFGLAPQGLRVPPTFLSLYAAEWVRRPADWDAHPENRP